MSLPSPDALRAAARAVAAAAVGRRQASRPRCRRGLRRRGFGLPALRALGGRRRAPAICVSCTSIIACEARLRRRTPVSSRPSAPPSKCLACSECQGRAGQWRPRRRTSARARDGVLRGEQRAALGFELLCTAHHLDDVVENALMRLARGAGLAGLAAPRVLQEFPRRPSPLAPADRGRHGRSRPCSPRFSSAGIPWREDATNGLLPIAARNRVRAWLAPRAAKRPWAQDMPMASRAPPVFSVRRRRPWLSGPGSSVASSFRTAPCRWPRLRGRPDGLGPGVPAGVPTSP